VKSPASVASRKGLPTGARALTVNSCISQRGTSIVGAFADGTAVDRGVSDEAPRSGAILFRDVGAERCLSAKSINAFQSAGVSEWAPGRRK